MTSQPEEKEGEYIIISITEQLIQDLNDIFKNKSINITLFRQKGDLISYKIGDDIITGKLVIYFNLSFPILSDINKILSEYSLTFTEEKKERKGKGEGEVSDTSSHSSLNDTSDTYDTLSPRNEPKCGMCEVIRIFF